MRGDGHMYISIKLPPAYGSFNRLKADNYPFNELFTEYLAAISRLGIEKGMRVEELVGWIEDRAFEGRRVPDVPEAEGGGPVCVRYRTEDPDVKEYIGGGEATNRMAVMYIARMTLRLSVEYGTSLFRLTRVISGLSGGQAEPVRAREEKPAGRRPRQAGASVAGHGAAPEKERPADGPKVTRRAVHAEGAVQEGPQRPASAIDSAKAAREALDALASLTGQEEGMDGTAVHADMAVQAEEAGGGDVVQMNPYLASFGG